MPIARRCDALGSGRSRCATPIPSASSRWATHSASCPRFASTPTGRAGSRTAGRSPATARTPRWSGSPTRMAWWRWPSRAPTARWPRSSGYAAERIAVAFRPMRVTMLSEVNGRPRRVAVGDFDGVHLGHREVIRGSDTVLTFEPHPRRVVRPEAAPQLLTSLEAKAELIGELGADELVVIPFDQGFAHQSPQEFIDHILVERLQATRVSVG